MWCYRKILHVSYKDPVTNEADLLLFKSDHPPLCEAKVGQNTMDTVIIERELGLLGLFLALVGGEFTERSGSDS